MSKTSPGLCWQHWGSREAGVRGVDILVAHPEDRKGEGDEKGFSRNEVKAGLITRGQTFAWSLVGGHRPQTRHVRPLRQAAD
jgi:hypothetical protein